MASSGGTLQTTSYLYWHPRYSISEYGQKINDLINTEQYIKISSDRTHYVERAVKKELNKIKKDIPDDLFHRLNPNNSVPPHIYGLLKIHNTGNLLRLSVSCTEYPERQAGHRLNTA